MSIKQAVLSHFGLNEANDINTWEWIKSNREKYPYKEYPVREGMENTWNHLNAYQEPSPAHPVIDRDNYEDTSSSPLGALRFLIESGFYPPPELLFFITECFDLYEAAAGELTLEEVFFGPPQKGVGNHAARKCADLKYRHFMYRETILGMKIQKQKDDKASKKSQRALAEEYIEAFYPHEDLDTFLRGYRRWRKSRRSETGDN